MYIQKKANEISVSYYANENEMCTNGEEGVKVEIKADSKQEDYEGKDTTIFDKIDTNRDKIVSFDELDAFVTQIKKKSDKDEAFREYVDKQKSKGDKAADIGFLTGIGLVFAGGAVLGGVIGKFQGMRVGHVLKKLVTNVTVKKIISNSCKTIGAGLMGFGGGVMLDSLFGSPVGGILGIIAHDMFINTKSDDELKKDFEKQYVEKELDKSQEWEISYDGENAYSLTSVRIEDLVN